MKCPTCHSDNTFISQEVCREIAKANPNDEGDTLVKSESSWILKCEECEYIQRN